MDTGTHLRAIWRRRAPVVAAAVVAALVVLGLRFAVSPVWTADAGLYLVPGAAELNDGTGTARLTTYYAQFLQDPRVLADLVRRSRLPLSTADVPDVVSVTSPSSGQLTVVAQQPSAARAAALANATGEALSAAALTDQREAQKAELAPLTAELTSLTTQLAALPAGDPTRAQLQSRLDAADQVRVDRLAAARARLDLVSRARAVDATKSPQPLRDAALAFVLVLVLAAEGAALAAARRKGIEGGDPVATLERWTDLPAFRVNESRHGPEELAAAVRFLDQGGSGTRYVVAVDPGPDTEAALEAVVAASGRVAARSWLPLGEAGKAPAGVTALKRAPATLPEGTLVTAPDWTDPRLLDLGERSAGSCALLVDAERVRAPDLHEAIRVLELSGLAPSALLVDAPASRRTGLDRVLRG